LSSDHEAGAELNDLSFSARFKSLISMSAESVLGVHEAT